MATTQDVYMELNVEGGGSDIDWVINGVTFDESEPLVVTGDTPTLITIRDRSRAEHPFHLHGDFFRVVSVNGEPPEHDGRYDTWLVESRDTLELYTELENPGRWMAHCHILEHAERGMMTELVVE